MSQKTKKRGVLVFLLILILAVLALPVSNLILGTKSSAMAQIATNDPVFAKALDVLSRKCGTCHSSSGAMPLYASLPVAKNMIQRDVEEGTAYMDYLKALKVSDGKQVPEVVLAKTEYVVASNAMPPTRFIAMHWNGALTAEDKMALNNWIHAVRRQSYATGGVAKPYEAEPIQPLPATVEVNAAKAAVGNKLFHDKRLSKDDSIACASCHDLAKGGTDQSQYSTGVGGTKGGINAPTVYNSGFQFIQFWDGRAADLQAQADGPVNNPAEMASNWPDSFAKLTQDAAFMQEFTAAYPDGLSKENCTGAIAEFEKTLVTPNCKLDKFLNGDGTALTNDEKEGYRIFKDNGCAMCHVGKLMGGQSFEKMGRKADYFADRGNPTDADNGRFSVTKDEADRHKLKVPTLRNIAKTAPYMHDGSVADLGKAVEIMAKYQVGRPLTQDQTQKIVAFLNCLTGEYNGQPLQ